MLKTVTHPFVPYQVAFARRDVMLTKEDSGARIAASSDECCNLRFLDAASFASKVRVDDWIVTRVSEDERYLWRIAEASGQSERPQIVLRPVVMRRRHSLPVGRAPREDPSTTAGSCR